MLHIILIILKIIGIVLALLLLLLLLGVLLILFVPLRYRITAGKDGKDLSGWGKISWLLNIIAIVAEYRNGKPTVRLKIFGIPKTFQSTVKKQKKTAKEDIPEPDTDKKETILDDKQERLTQEPEPMIEDSVPDGKWERFKYKCKTFLGKIKQVWDKISSFPKRIGKYLRKVLKFKLKVQKIWNLLKGDGIELLKIYKEYLLYLWKHLRPRKITGSLQYGFEDPSITGQFTGILYILLPASCDNLLIQPDFEQAVLEGELMVKGYIRCIHLLRIGWKVYKDKDLRRFIAGLRS